MERHCCQPAWRKWDQCSSVHMLSSQRL